MIISPKMLFPDSLFTKTLLTALPGNLSIFNICNQDVPSLLRAFCKTTPGEITQIISLFLFEIYYSWLPITQTLVNSNLALTQTKVDFPCGFPSVADLGGGCRGCAPPPPQKKMTCGFLIQLVFWYSLLKFVYVTNQLRHSLVVHHLLRKILDPPLSSIHLL